MPSSLNSEDKTKIKRAIPKASNKIIIAAVARLYVAFPNPHTWKFTGLSGAVVLAKDSVSDAYFLKLVDVVGHGQVLWDQELWKGFQYNQDRTFFHSFEMEGFLGGLSFAEETEAQAFFKKLTALRLGTARPGTAPPANLPTSTGRGENYSGNIFADTPAQQSNDHSNFSVASNSYQPDRAPPNRQTSISSSTEGNSKTWKELLSELEGLGITPDMIENNRDFVRQYVQEAYGDAAVAEMDAETGKSFKKPSPPPPPGLPRLPGSFPTDDVPSPTTSSRRENVPPPPPPPPPTRKVSTTHQEPPPPPPSVSAPSRRPVPPPFTGSHVSASPSLPPKIPLDEDSGRPNVPPRSTPRNPPPQPVESNNTHKFNVPPPFDLSRVPPPPPQSSLPPPLPGRSRGLSNAPPPVPVRNPGVNAPPAPPPRAEHSLARTPAETHIPPPPPPPPTSRLPPQLPKRSTGPPPPPFANGSGPPPPPPPPPMSGGPPPPPPPPSSAGPSKGGPPPPPGPPPPTADGPPLPPVEPVRGALLSSIRGAGGIKALKKVDSSQRADRSSALAAPSSPATPDAKGVADNPASILAAALAQRKGKVSHSDDEDNGDDWD